MVTSAVTGHHRKYNEKGEMVPEAPKCDSETRCEQKCCQENGLGGLAADLRPSKDAVSAQPGEARCAP